MNLNTIKFIFLRIKIIAHNLLNYSVFIVYRYNKPFESRSVSGYDFSFIDKKDLTNSGDKLISSQEWYGGYESYIAACSKEGRIVSICVYWYGGRYAIRNFWPLRKKEAKLVQIVTLPEVRGQGIGANLIQYSAGILIDKGFENLYARVWHSNKSSRKAFEKSNWSAVATVFEIQPIERIKPIRICINKK